MNYRLSTTLLLLFSLYGCQQSSEPGQTTAIEPTVEQPAEPIAQLVSPESGIETSGFDTQVRPQDDFYHYVNGTWLRETKIPADKSNYGSFNVVADVT